MAQPIKYAEKAVTVAANVAWKLFTTVNSIAKNPSFTPKWSDKPLLKSWEKQKPPLGWPRTTDSLCPKCVPDMRNKIVNGELPVEILRNEKMGEIKAQIIERDGKILMVKECAIHGHFEDVMAMDPAFLKQLEDVSSPAATSAPTTTKSSTTTAPPPSPTAAARCSPSI